MEKSSAEKKLEKKARCDFWLKCRKTAKEYIAKLQVIVAEAEEPLETNPVIEKLKGLKGEQ